MQKVEWRPVKGFEGYYDVSDKGEIWSKRRHKTLSPTIDRYGYKKVVLSINGIPFHRTVHRLVAQAFIDNPCNFSTVNHINEIKTDNRVENLEWADVKTNVNHGTRNSRMSDSLCKRPVEQILSNGNVVVYKGVKDASLKTGIHRSCIAKCCRNIRKTAGGFKWRYVNATD